MCTTLFNKVNKKLSTQTTDMILPLEFTRPMCYCPITPRRDIFRLEAFDVIQDRRLPSWFLLKLMLRFALSCAM